MSNVNVFSTKFVSAVRDCLKSACAEGERCSREAVVAHLATVGINATPALVGLAVSTGAIDSDKVAYGLFQGRRGGIREVDLEASKAEEARMAEIAQAEAARQAAIDARVAKAVQTKLAKKALREAAKAAPQAQATA